MAKNDYFVLLWTCSITAFMCALLTGDPIAFLSWFLNALHQALGGKKNANKITSCIEKTFQGSLRLSSRKVIPIELVSCFILSFITVYFVISLHFHRVSIISCYEIRRIFKCFTDVFRKYSTDAMMVKWYKESPLPPPTISIDNSAYNLHTI